MISAKDFYNVMAAVVPLYVAMLLAYGSVRWWRILTPDQCGGINRFVALFAVPLLSFQIISKNNPYTMNLKFIAADSIQKAVVILVLVIWARYSSRASFEWVITHFMVATLPNTLVMGIPLLDAMYGKEHGSLVVQAVVLQCIVWYTLLLFMYEYRSARILIMEQFPDTAASIVSFKVDSDVVSLDGREQAVLTEAEVGEDGRIHVKVRKSTSSAASARYSSASVHHFGFGQFDLNSGNKSMFSSTPRPSNLTGAEIYSLHSSRNITPRDSSFSRGDAYLMNMNFNVANSTQIHTALNKTESNQSNNILGAYSPSGMHLPRKVNSNNNHYHPPRTSDYDAKELHMFVWSSSASPTSDRVFGGTDGDSKETKLVVVADESQMDDSKERVSEYAQHQEFSFGDVPGYTPTTDKLQGSSTVELAPKLADNTGAANDRGGNYKMPPATVMTKLILDMVWRKLLRNPNTYSSIIGLVWALVSFRWHLKAPKIIEKSITILSDAGLGMAMFSLGLFMALQPRILACGTSMAMIGMVLRFFCSPAIMSMSSIAVGLRKLDLRASIVQAALPQGIVPFVFAKEYNVHPDVLSTAVIFGMLVALPITLVYYVLLGI